MTGVLFMFVAQPHVKTPYHVYFCVILGLIWDGRWESNPRITEPQSVALPLGYTRHK